MKRGKAGKLKTVMVETIQEIAPREPSLLEAKICSKCLMRHAVGDSDSGLCRECEPAASSRGTR